MLAAIQKMGRELVFGGDRAWSLSRLVVLLVLVQINAVVVLACLWIYHVTVTQQMEAAAPLANAVFTGVAGVLGAQATMAALQYAVAQKWGSGGYSDARRGAVDGDGTEGEP